MGREQPKPPFPPQDMEPPGLESQMDPRPRYEAPATQGQYTEVSILWNGQMITTIPVTEAH